MSQSKLKLDQLKFEALGRKINWNENKAEID